MSRNSSQPILFLYEGNGKGSDMGKEHNPSTRRRTYSRDPDEPCPDNHVSYLSHQTALNAAALHRMANPLCQNISIFPHGDHYHIGHESQDTGRKCRGVSGRKK